MHGRVSVVLSLSFLVLAPAATAQNVTVAQLIDPYTSCTAGPDQVCTRVDVGGATALGHAYPAALCEDVRHVGRPYHKIPVPHRTRIDDPRLNDKKFMVELAWVTSQIKATACTCCHDSATDHHAAMWDIASDAIWTDQMTPRAIAMMAGRFDSAVFGSIPAALNNGFDRSQTGAPTTDIPRMQAYFDAELDRRGITAADIAKMPPFGIPRRVGTAAH